MAGTVGSAVAGLQLADGTAAAVDFVRSVQSLVAQVDAGRVTGHEAEELMTSVVEATAAIEATMSALAARRAALLGVAAAIVRVTPEVMVPREPGRVARLEDRELARRALVADVAVCSGASESTTSTLLETAAELTTRLPGVLAMMAAGVIGDAAARRVVRQADGVPDSAVAHFEAGVLARVASDRTPAGLDRAARAVREKVHPEAAAARHVRAAAERSVTLDPAPDGMAWLTAFLPAVQATAIHDRLTRVARMVGEDPAEKRTLAQRRADVLVALTLDTPVPEEGGDHVLDGALDDGGTGVAAPGDAAARWAVEPGCGGGTGVAESGDAAAGWAVEPGCGGGTGVAESGDAAAGWAAEPGFDADVAGGDAAPVAEAGRPSRGGEEVSSPAWTLGPWLRDVVPTVAVTVPALTLLGLSEEPGDLEGYGPIDADTARRLAAAAPSFIRLLTHPETGAVLSVGRDRYRVPADLRTWLRLRDGVCRFPGCHRPASGCDADHTVAYTEGGAMGETAGSNLAHLCRAHHRLKHATRWRVSQDSGGSLTWTSPTGTVAASDPYADIPATLHTDEPCPEDPEPPPEDAEPCPEGAGRPEDAEPCPEGAEPPPEDAEPPPEDAEPPPEEDAPRR